MTWRELLEQWPLIESDLFEAGVDVGDPALMRGRSWRWGSGKILGLLTAPPAGQTQEPVDEKHIRLRPVWRYRIQAHIYGEGA